METDRVAVCDALTVSTRGMKNDGPRTVALYENRNGRPRRYDEVYGVDDLELPDQQPAADETASLGHEDDYIYELRDEDGVLVVKRHDNLSDLE